MELHPQPKMRILVKVIYARALSPEFPNPRREITTYEKQNRRKSLNLVVGTRVRGLNQQAVTLAALKEEK